MRYVKEIIEGVPVWREASSEQGVSEALPGVPVQPEAREFCDCRLPKARRDTLKEISLAFEVTHTHEELMYLAGAFEVAANRKYARSQQQNGTGE